MSTLTKALIACISLTGLNLLAATPARAAEQPIIIKFSHVAAPDAPKGLAAEYFKKLAEERTHGRVKVEVYANSVLYKEKEGLEALQLGAVQMLAPSPGQFAPMGIKEYEVLDLPYLFDSIASAQKVTQGPIGKQLLKKLEVRGLLGLAFWDNGFRVLTSNKPIRLPSDLRGQKIRIDSSKVTDQRMRDVGVLPQNTSFAELYTALQTGVVDGQENPLTHVWTQKFYEVQKYLTVTNHAYHGYVAITNKKFWDGLPPDIRAILEGAMKDTTAKYAQIAQKETDEAFAGLKKSGRIEIHQPTPAELTEWKKAFTKVHGEVMDRVGRDLVQSIYKETGFNPAKL